MKYHGLTASEVVDAHLLECLPPESPRGYDIVEARFISSPSGRACLANLRMFDGEHAEVEVFSKDGDSWAHRWIDVGGAPAELMNGTWRRVAAACVGGIQ
jgi:hypothetical protein